ncbi:hypothetical protein UA08_08822 [Talaromyces atroroseus]|uniref:Uncharacterized protein n=1 Tax=Talaromyces atroroseus TaxID=1441469 RepID=A0A225ANA7_TALAT|nr:hypothetical protein UA08_08822 [Talaromyces atroroseus]OKL55915.1 hypothetical protein UA08_08822 [Talaromyces atroroseus]
MDSILLQIRELFGKADADSRDGIVSALGSLLAELRNPVDILYDAYASILQAPMAMVAVDLGLFRKLAALELGSSRTVSQLAEDTGADVNLLERILRYLASISYVQEVGPDRYTASKLTHMLANPMMEAALTHSNMTMIPAVNATPAFLKETGYKNITDGSKTPFQKAFNTQLKAFDYIAGRPEMFDALQVVMTSLESSNWTAGFELFQKEVQSFATSTSERQFLVDVGGGHGHQCAQLLHKYPSLRGKLTLEDLPEAVNKASRTEGISYVAQDFFKPQIIRGAKFYYMRRIMHDWPEHDCVTILKQLADVFADDSRILLDEVVLPDTGANLQSTMADLSMMVAFAGAERTSRNWHQLVEKAGLKIVQIHTFDVKRSYSIIVLEKH